MLKILLLTLTVNGFAIEFPVDKTKLKELKEEIERLQEKIEDHKKTIKGLEGQIDWYREECSWTSG